MISKLTDEELLRETKNLVHMQRKTLVQIIDHLIEVQRRRLYAELGYSSLFKYLVFELKYSEGAAWRRISAMKMSVKVPEVKGMIQSGQLSLGVLAKTQSFCKELDRKETEKVIEKVKDKTQDGADLELLKLVPDGEKIKKRDREVRQTDTETRLHITLKNETLEKLEKFKALKKLSAGKAIDLLLDDALLAFEKSLEVERKFKASINTKEKRGRSISRKVQKKLLQRAMCQCEFPGCDERSFLEIEHVKPFALGGSHELENLKLYCKTHNQRAAIKAFGQEKMDFYLNEKRA